MVRLLHYSDVENAYDDPERIARLAGAIERHRGEDALVVGTGDNTGPGALALATRGGQSLAFFDAVDPTAETFGNHDFDYGPERTRELVERSPQPWVTANVFDGDQRFGAEVGTESSIVVDCNGTTVGLIGVTDPATTEMCPPAAELRFDDPVECVRRERDRLDADAIVVLSHAGRADAAIARETDVDAVLGGHIHEETVDWIGDVPCTRPGANATALLEIDLAERSVTRHEVAEMPVDEAVKAAIEAEFGRQDLGEVLAHVDDPIDRSRETLRAGEAAIGNFVADAYRWAADADVGLQNTPGLRAGPPLEGAVTKADIVSLVPFNDTVAVARIGGERLRTVLRQAEGGRMTDLGDYWHAQLSGVTVVRGEDLTVHVGGEPLDPDATYTLATSNYLFETPIEFPALTEDDREKRLGIQYEVVADYAREFGIDPSVEGRIQGP